MLRSFLGLLILISLARSEFLPERLRIVDNDPKLKSFLVRGNLPINQHRQFQIEELKGNLTQITGLNRYRLIVISFLNTLTAKETKNKYIEQKFFRKNKKIAEYRSRVILGSLLDPTEMPNWTAKILSYIGQKIDFDDIDGLIQELHEEVHGNKNTIIYIHCSAGVDRTGYVSGAYKMKYLGSTFQEVLQENLEVLKGVRKYMHFNCENGLQWFCYHLGKTQEQCSVPQ